MREGADTRTVEDQGVTLEHRTLTWIRSEAISADPVSGPNGVWSDDAVYRPLLAQQTITRDGRSWTTTYTYHTGQGTINDHGQPYAIDELGETIYQWRRTTRTFQTGFTPYLAGRVASETVQQNSAYGQSDGSTSSSWTYDLATGFLTSQTVRGFTTTFEPRVDGNVAAVVDGRGKRTTFGYSWGRVTSVDSPLIDTSYVISPEGLVTSHTQGELTTTYEYDGAFRLSVVRPPASNPILYYPDDLHGGSVRVLRGDSVVDHVVDAFGREMWSVNSQGLTVGVLRDSCGRVFAASDPYTTTTTTFGTTVQYDALGRVTQVTDAAGKTTTFTLSGPSVIRTDANGRTTTYEGIAFGDPSNASLVRVTDALNQVTQYRYDVTGALAKVMGPLAGVERTWSIDSQGLVASDTQPESGTTTYTYDAVGNVKTITTADAEVTTLTYDDNNRLSLRDAPGTDDDVAITYDTSGRTQTLTGGGMVTTFTYDVPNRRVTRTDQTVAGTFSSSYATDANGNLDRLMNRTGLVGGSIPREDGPDGTTQQVFPRAA